MKRDGRRSLLAVNDRRGRIAITLASASLVVGCAAHDPARPADRPSAVVEAPPHSASAGERAPALAVKDIEGQPLSIEKGRVTILVFWATWSMPDQRELVRLQDLYVLRARDGVDVIAISVDDEPSQVPDFAKRYGLRFRIAWDDGRRIASAYRPWAEPTTYVIDRAGVIRFVHSAYHDGEDADIAREVTTLLRP